MRLVQELPDRGASIAPRVAAILGERARLGRGSPGGRGRDVPRERRARVRAAGRVAQRDRGQRCGWWIRPASAAPSPPERRPGWLPISSSRSTRARPRRARSPSTEAAHRSRPRAGGVPAAATRRRATSRTTPRTIWSSQLRVAQRGGLGGRRGRADRRHRHDEPARDHDASGNARPAGPSRRRSCGRAGSPPRSASSSRPMAREPLFRERTGLPLDAYFSGPKIAPHPRRVPGDLHARAERGELAFGTVDSFLVWRLTGGSGPRDRRLQRVAHAAASTSDHVDWDDELLRLMEVPRAVLPSVRPSSARLGRDRRVALRPPDPDRGRRRRPAGGDLRPGVLRSPGRPRTRTARARSCW